MNDVIALLAYLPRKKRLQTWVLLLLMLCAALLDILGVVSVIPFLALIGSSAPLHDYPFLAKLYKYLGATSFEEFVFQVGAIFFLAVFISAAFRIVVQYLTQRMAQDISGWVSKTLFHAYLYQPYLFFVGRNGGEMAKNILSETANAIAHVVHPTGTIIAYSVVLVVLFVILLFVDAKISLAVLLFLVTLYSLVSMLAAPLLRIFGAKSVFANKARYTICSEALSGIKSVKAAGLEGVYLDRFSVPSSEYTRFECYSQVIAQAPRQLIEAIGIGAVILMALYFFRIKQGVGEVLPLLGVYVLAGNKMLPAAQQIYQGFSQIRYGLPSLRAIINDLALLDTRVKSEETNVVIYSQPPCIELIDISFRYPDTQKDVLQKVSLAIPPNTSLGIVGASGAGKTTLGDILLGLLTPTNGSIKVDGVSRTLFGWASWKRVVGYVPQDVYLIDASIAENIALGVPQHQIDWRAMETATRIANIFEFITRECPAGFDTPVGERGARLSGGQQQRLGIARALYNDPQILIFDEATSALDAGTERAIIEAIDALAHKKTIIMIAHRAQALKRIDRIVFLDMGKIAGVGTFEELLETSIGFRAMSAHGK